MQNTLMDLNNILFEQIERINDDELTGEALKESIKKANTINCIAETLVQSASVQLRAIQYMGAEPSIEVARILGIGG